MTAGWGGPATSGTNGWDNYAQVRETDGTAANGDAWQIEEPESDDWANENKATDVWSTQPASGEVWTAQAAGDGWANDAWIDSKPAAQADPWQDQNNGDAWSEPGPDDSRSEKCAADDPPAVPDIKTQEEEHVDQRYESPVNVSKQPTDTEDPHVGGDGEPTLENDPFQHTSSADHIAQAEADWPNSGTKNDDEELNWDMGPPATEWGNEGSNDQWATPASANNEWNVPASKLETTQEEDDAYESFENVSNIIDAPWPSKMDYLRTHYLLLREDALRPLRESVEHVRSMPDLNEDPARATTGIYDQVQLCGITFARKGLGIRVKFSLGRVGKNIHWAQSKRLLTGSLVVLMSPDKSKCKVATVAARPLEMLSKSPPEVDLFFGRSEDLDIDCSQDWIMVEERGSFFEAQRHTLVALQRMIGEKFPLQEHFVNLETAIPPPTYIMENPVRDLRPISSIEMNQQELRDVDVLREWPSKIHDNLDPSQMTALNTILTKQLSIVQGPPGTGKTYVSVEALKVMLRNMAPSDPPIIITCQTNHALDQLLSHVAKFEPKYVRIGSRSSSEEIKKRTLYELKKDRKPAPFKQHRRWRQLEDEMGKLIYPLIKGPTGLESRDTFELELLRELGVLSNEQCDSVVEGAKQWISHDGDSDDRPLLKWIGKQLEPVKLRHQPVLVGYEEIDEGNIGFEEVMEAEAEQVIRDEEEDYEGLGGTFWPIGDTWTGRAIDNKQARDQARELLKTKHDLWKIRSSDRGNVYRHIQREAKIKIADRLRKLFPDYEGACEDRKIHRWEHEETILKENKVVGLTTTGVSKYRGLIAALKPKIVIIEEAAETLEAPVIAACMESVEHLILVGDHKQLRPNCHVMALQKPPFNLNISLFERLVNNNVSYSILSRQRRMKPEIRRILSPIYGSKVRDHSSVQKLENRPPIPGMGGLTTWFFTHEHPDERDQEFSSFNTLEAEMILGLVQYLHYNGVAADQITILTFYNGQRRLIKRRFTEDERARGNNDLRNVQLKTVDSYQGEENEIIILSLVRSNMEGKIGFIGVDNRVCVALSRARRGFYILGNAQLLCNESWLWSQVILIMSNGFVCTAKKTVEEQPHGRNINPRLPKDRRVGYTLPLWCERHQRQFWIEGPADWQRNVGGCDRRCGGRLPCGHPCPENCHPWPHQLYSCKAPCMKMLACGHKCSRDCYMEPCECASACSRRRGEGPVAASNNATVGAESAHARAQPTESLDSAVRRYQQFANDGAVDESRAFESHLPQQEGRVRSETLARQNQLDEENSRLLFRDDASHDDVKAKLVDYKEQPDGSIERRWEMVHTTRPGKKATAAAEAKFYSLMDE